MIMTIINKLLYVMDRNLKSKKSNKKGGIIMKRLIVIIMAISMLLTATAVFAATETDSLDVLANVIERCRVISTTDVDFGDYDPTDPSPDNDGQGSVTMRCTRGTNYETYIDRTNVMSFGAESLNYELYSDVARTAVYQSALPGILDLSASNAPVTKFIYGQIPPEQDALAGGPYNETVTFTIEY